MKLEPTALRDRFAQVQAGKASDHSADMRRRPSIWRYDHLLLRALADDVHALIDAAGRRRSPGEAGIALDVGSFRSPYAPALRAHGFVVRTLDLTAEHGADHVGTAEATGLPDESVDLVVCTQVLEHVRTPWTAMREFHRILKPGGAALVSIPHVWFYHPHPGDYWRVTQEGMVALCEDGGFTVHTLLAQGGSVTALGQIVNFMAYGVLGDLGAPVYAIVNAGARLGERLLPNELFTLNLACLAIRH